MAGATHDDGFHEIQLNGKQLVFLFMAVTVVSVVIFLCGVLVGRGVRLDRGQGDATTFQATAPESAPPPPVDSGASSNAPVTPQLPITYPGQLAQAAPPNEKLAQGEPPAPKPEAVAEAPAPTPPPVADTRTARKEASAAPPPPPEKKTEAPLNPSLAEPQGPGMAVQVSAFRVRSEAEALATRLVGKGYTAYVVPPAPGAPALFRVRVGKFKEQGEANRIAQKLKKEEQFDPWIVR